jgi:putative methyltransferase (TIGR04325 family)
MLGWNVESIRQIELAKWPRFVELVQSRGPLGVAHEATSLSGQDLGAHNTIMAFAYVLALTAHKKDSISVLDWGGSLGHYAVLARALLPKVAIEYHIKDVPLMCQSGREVHPDVSFHEDDGCLKRSYDLVMACSSLQYSEDWRGVLRILAAAAQDYLLVTRLPVVSRVASFPVVQRPSPYGYLTEYAGWFVNRNELLVHMNDLGMELCREFLVDERHHVEGAPEQCEYVGFLFQPCTQKAGLAAR